MNKYKRLLSDSLLYMLGNFGSKLVSLLMVPFYTHTLLPSEYGSIDVATTTIALLLPLVTCCVQQAVLTLVLKSEKDESELLSNGIIVCLINSVVLAMISALCYSIWRNSNIMWIAALCFVEGMNLILLQFARAINKTKLYAFSGVIVTFTIAALNIVFLNFLRLGLTGYYLSMVIGYSVSVIMLSIGCRINKFFHVSLFNTHTIQRLFALSIPLIPNSLMWWLMNALDRYAILYELGSDWNGIYAVAGKIPMILSTLSSIFIQAWQVSAIVESGAEDKGVFYSTVFRVLVSINVFAFSGLMIVVKPVLTIFISSDYPETWKFVPFLLLGTICTCLAGFFGANYLASQNTKGEMTTSFFGGLTNMILNPLLIHFIGLNGAAIATFTSLFIVCVVRYHDTRKFIDIIIDWKKISFYLIIIVTEIFALYFLPGISVSVVSIIGCVLILGINRDIWFPLVCRIVEKDNSGKWKK